MMMMIAMMVAALNFTACSSDDDETSEVSICGTWKLVSVNVNGKVDNGGDIWYVNEDHTYRVDENDGTTSSGTWSLNDNKLTLTDGELPIPITYTITELTETRLTFTLSQMGGSWTFNRQ